LYLEMCVMGVTD